MDTAQRSISRLTAEFTDPAVEQRFRARDAPAAARHAISAIAFGAVFHLLFSYNDYVALGPVPELWLLLSGRVLFALAAGVGIVMLVRRPERAGSGVVVTVLALLLSATFLLVVLVRPGPLTWHMMIMVVILLAVTLAVPNRFVYVLAVGVGTTAAFGLGVGLVVRPPLLDVLRIVLILSSANAAGLLTAYRFSTLRRAEFALLLQAEAMNADLTREVNERMRLEEELRRAASTDPLTGLFNRRHFLELAQRELARARRATSPLVVCVLDVDHFKSVNDRFGHAVGDAALRAVAATCRDALREVDLVARYGGEEFTFCLPDTDVASAQLVAERLRLALAAMRVETPQGPLALTATLGLAECLWDEPDVLPALQRADQALYEGKRAGRNRVVAARPPCQDATG